MPPRGRSIPLSLPRRLVIDMLHYARKVPTVPVQRSINVAALRDARRQIDGPPSWCVIFTKAYALVTARFPELRCAYLSFPRPYLYEHPFSIASVAVERQYQDENGVFFVHLRGPENQTLTALEDHLRRFKEEPLERIGLYRRALHFSRLPRPLRRFAWWFGLNSSGPKRAARMGTFGVSVYSGSWCGIVASAIGADDHLDLRNHRRGRRRYGPPDLRPSSHGRLDGGAVLAALDETLNREILTELRGLAAPRRADDDGGNQLLAG